MVEARAVQDYLDGPASGPPTPSESAGNLGLVRNGIRGAALRYSAGIGRYSEPYSEIRPCLSPEGNRP